VAIRRLLRHSAVYGLAGLVTRLTSVILLPVYARYLTPGDYGSIETMAAFQALAVPILRGGVGAAFYRFAYGEERAAVIRTSFWFTAVGAAIGAVLTFALAEPIAAALLSGSGDAGIVRATALTLWAWLIYEQVGAIYRVEERSLAFARIVACNLAITIAATLTFVVSFGWGPVGAILGNGLGTAAAAIGMTWARRRELGLRFDGALARRMHRFGLPLVPAAVLTWVVDLSDRFILGQMNGQSDVGLYAVAAKIASALVLVQTMFSFAWPAFAFAIEDDDQARSAISRGVAYVVGVSAWLATALALLAPWLVRWLTQPEYAGAADAVGPLAFGGAFMVAYLVITIGAGRGGDTRRFWVVPGAAAILNVVLNLALIPELGIRGSAYATLAANALLAIGMALLGQSVYHIPYRWVAMAGSLALGGALAALGRAIDVPLAGAVALIAVYPAVIWAARRLV
jgi:O-antigen/teichoic acid export membrane protein